MASIDSSDSGSGARSRLRYPIFLSLVRPFGNKLNGDSGLGLQFVEQCVCVLDAGAAPHVDERPIRKISGLPLRIKEVGKVKRLEEPGHTFQPAAGEAHDLDDDLLGAILVSHIRPLHQHRRAKNKPQPPGPAKYAILCTDDKPAPDVHAVPDGNDRPLTYDERGLSRARWQTLTNLCPDNGPLV